MTKPITGHIFGKDLTEIHFVFDSIQPDKQPTEVELGQILVIEDKTSLAKFLVRITNIQYGQNPAWSQEVARTYNRFTNKSHFADDHEDPSQMFQDDRTDQLYNVAICEILGFIDKADRFISPKKLPSYFSQVRLLEKEDLDGGESKENSLASKLGDIPFGKIRSGSEIVDVKAGLFKELVAKHVGIFAQTGGGKSNTMKVLTMAVMETEGEVGMLLFEPHGEYIDDLPKHPLATRERLEMFSADGTKGRQLRISYQDLTVDALMNIKNQMNWTEPQERFMREAEYVLGDDWFRFVMDTPFDEEEAYELGLHVPQTIADVFKIKKGNPLEPTIRALKSKLRRVAHAKYLDPNPHVSNIDEILSGLDSGKIMLIDMAGISGLQEILLSTILTSELLKRRKRLYSSDKAAFEQLPPVAVVMEEAQRVLGKDGNRDSNVFAQVCNEGRKFKTGLFAITQQPKLMSEVLVSQFNTLIILSISDQRDFDILSSISKKPIDKLRFEIRSLMPGQAIVTNPLSPFALPIQVDFFDDFIEKAKEKYKDRKTTKPKRIGII